MNKNARGRRSNILRRAIERPPSDAQPEKKTHSPSTDNLPDPLQEDGLVETWSSDLE